MTLTPEQIGQNLSLGAAALRAGELSRAEQAFGQVLNAVPDQSDALHLMGIIKKSQKQFAAAESFFKRSLNSNADQPQVLNNLGNLLKDLSRPEEAKNCYTTAIELDPSFADPHYSLGQVFHQQSDYEKAEHHLSQAIRSTPDEPRFHTALGVLLKDQGKLQQAVAAYKSALRLRPTYLYALHNLGVALGLQNNHSGALEYFERAVEQGPRIPELRLALANTYVALGEHDKADTQYRTAVALKPDYVEAHDSLNKLYWEQGRTDVFAKSYEVCIPKAHGSASLREAYVKALELSGNYEAAMDATQKAFKDVGRTPDLLRRHARLLANKDRPSEALAALEEAVKSASGNLSIRMDTARLLIQMGDYRNALHHLDQVAIDAPFNQEMWAYRSLCWRLLGDPNYQWLNDYENFVMQGNIETPDGFESLPAFLSRLQADLRALHKGTTAPLDQSLRGGTQTLGNLFDTELETVQALKQQVQKHVTRYIENLPDDDGHPLLSRKTDGFRFGGSWSVELSSDGFHVNHVHSNGWISSAFYVDVPLQVRQNGGTHEGWIKFGESGLNLGSERECIEKIVQPQPGLLVLFPSYMWHGTVPFKGKSTRLTAPFDIVPSQS